MPLAQKTGRREVYKTRQKTSIRKVRQYVKNVPKKCTPQMRSFCGFSGSGAKGVPGWSQRLPEHSTRSNLVEILTNNCRRNRISVMLYWVLSQTEPTCPKEIPGGLRFFPEASRVLIRAICKGLPRRRQEKANKNPNTHFQSDGILTVSVRSVGFFQSAPPRCIPVETPLPEMCRRWPQRDSVTI